MVKRIIGNWQQSGQTRGVVVVSQGTLAGLRLYRKVHVLLIGVSEFQYLEKRHWLPGAVNDVRALKQVLSEFYEVSAADIRVLCNQQATKQGIEDALSALTDKNQVTEDDAVLIFFATHGVTLFARADQYFLVPYDARISPDDPSPNPADFNRSCVSLSSIHSTLRTSPARQVVLIADTCFSGELGEQRDLGTPRYSPEQLRRWAMEPAVIVLTAGTSRQVAWESGAWGAHGALAKAIVDELRTHAERHPGEGLAIGDLARRVRHRVSSSVPQDPQLRHWSGTGEFIFVAKSRPGVGVAQAGSVQGGQPQPQVASAGVLTVSSVEQLMQAVQNAGAGSEIQLQPGVYQLSRPLVVSKSLTFSGVGEGSVQVVSQDGSEILVLDSGTCKVQNLVLGYERTRPTRPLIRVRHGQLTLTDCVLQQVIPVVSGTSQPREIVTETMPLIDVSPVEGYIVSFATVPMRSPFTVGSRADSAVLARNRAKWEKAVEPRPLGDLPQPSPRPQGTPIIAVEGGQLELRGVRLNAGSYAVAISASGASELVADSVHELSGAILLVNAASLKVRRSSLSASVFAEDRAQVSVSDGSQLTGTLQLSGRAQSELSDCKVSDGSIMVCDEAQLRLHRCRLSRKKSSLSGQDALPVVVCLRDSAKAELTENVFECESTCAVLVSGRAHLQANLNQFSQDVHSSFKFVKTRHSENGGRAISRIRLNSLPALATHAGIVATDESRIQVSESTFKNGVGVLLLGSAEGDLRKNQCRDNLGIAIGVFGRARLDARGNLCEGTRGSHPVEDSVVDFLPESEGGCGIALLEYAQAELTDNTCRQNAFAGILVSEHARLTAHRNHCTHNRAYGVCLKWNASATLKANICKENGSGGVLMSGIAKAVLLENECAMNGSYWTSSLTSPSANVESVSSSGDARESRLGLGIGSENSGIIVIEQSRVEAIRNRCVRNIYAGISVWDSATAELRENHCRENFFGVAASYFAHLVAEGNICEDNSEAGFYFTHAASGSVRANTCLRNGVGLLLDCEARPQIEPSNRLVNNKRANMRDARRR
ncbi:MAG: right-handed parallel beta-helix repeat-containing protein [Fimbriimonadales bacterium]|nr:right-handed parallel beta-helix repeat-containing protein [Fimbriimonadales bacterium]